MTTTLTNLFAAANNNDTENKHALTGTAELTAIASKKANNLVNMIDENDERECELLVAAQTDAVKLDELIETIGEPIMEDDIYFLRLIDTNELEGMFKSQQSKKSRCKSKIMTADNFTAMLTAAYAEKMLRMVLNKEASSHNRRKAGVVTFSQEELDALANDRAALDKAIRNVQSKKSIEKSKVGFSVESERWLSLLEAERQLKDLRTTASDTTQLLKETLGDVNINELKKDEAIELLNKLAGLI